MEKPRIQELASEGERIALKLSDPDYLSMSLQFPLHFPVVSLATGASFPDTG